MTTNIPNITSVESFLRSWQKDIITMLEGFETDIKFQTDAWKSKLGNGQTCTLTDGDIIEKAGVNFSTIQGDKLPPAATKRHPELAALPFQAMGVSIVVHPRNPNIPTSHANLRVFFAHPEGQDPVWWFGGGFDLTPYTIFEEDCVLWHQAAFDACKPFGETIYSEFKAQCDDYFYLKHRDETRGVGGLFFDDLNRWSFDTCFKFIEAVGDAYLTAYQTIIQNRSALLYGEKERNFQAYRRARYVEFNLLFDRGTLFGIQAGGRTESILVSMPPVAKWSYQWAPEPNSPETNLYKYLKPIDWLKLNA